MATASSDVSPTNNAPTNVAKVAVYTFLMDNKKRQGILLPLEDGLCAKASEIHEKMVRALGIPSDHGRAFAVWMTSPHLQLQLKDHHKPCVIKKKWKAMVAKFTKASVLEIETDEPIVSFQRSCFLSVDIEKDIANPTVIKLLYWEAATNVNQHRYPLTEEDFLELASTQSIVENGFHQPSTCRSDYSNFIMGRVQAYIPYQIRKSTWSMAASAKMFGTKTKAQKLADQFVERYRDKSETTGGDVHTLSWMKLYLKYCRQFDFYGSVFFKGQVQHPKSHKAVFVDRPDKDVYVGINPTHFHVIDAITNEILVGVPLKDLSWDYKEASEESDHHFSSFFIDFNCEGETCSQGSHVQIFSRQAAMMDSMVYRCVNDLHPETFAALKSACSAAETASSDELKVPQPAPRRVHPIAILKKKMSLQAFDL